MRIVSLLPAATEIVAALGAGSWLVGVSHECDYPPDVVRGLPRITRTQIDNSHSPAEIDRAVRAAGAAATAIDAALLADLRPDVIVGQSVCDVCAVGEGQLSGALTRLPHQPVVVTLHAHTLEEVFGDVARVGAALDLAGEADELVAGMRYRLRRISQSVSQHPTHDSRRTAVRPDSRRTVVIEWLDPPYVAGHWVPELVAIAGGADVGNVPGARSVTRTWAELRALDPDRIVIAECGFDVARARRDLAAVRDDDALALFSRGVVFLDGNAYTSRPGPRLVDAAEQLARLLTTR
jgi:iron complex transport system substrate-binding protein